MSSTSSIHIYCFNEVFCSLLWPPVHCINTHIDAHTHISYPLAHKLPSQFKYKTHAHTKACPYSLMGVTRHYPTQWSVLLWVLKGMCSNNHACILLYLCPKWTVPGQLYIMCYFQGIRPLQIQYVHGTTT